MYYKDCDMISLGYSDIAALVAVTPEKPEWLLFGGDGTYRAYLLHEDDELGDHYHEVLRAKYWLKIYDDAGLRFFQYADEIVVYRAGDYGCAIRLIGKR